MMPMPEPRDTDTVANEQLHHLPRIVGTRPLPAPIGADDESSFDARRTLSALKYHWFLFMVLGSLLGAALGTAAWMLLPAKYTTTALLRVNSNNAGLLGADPTTARSEFLTFLRTQADAIRSENVLRAALRDSKIGSTDTLKSVDDPVRWLQENVVVEFSEHSELMKVSMTGENAPELAEIINAINAAYMKEVVLVDQLKKKSVLDQLDRSRQQVEEKVKNLKVTLDLKRKKPASNPESGAAPVDQEPLKHRVGAAEFARMNDEYRRVDVNVKLAEQRMQTLQAKRDKVDAQEIPAQELDEYFKRDPEFKDLVDRAERANKQYEFVRNSYSSPAHIDVLHARQKADAAKVAADDYRRTKRTELVRQVQIHNRKIMDAEIEKAGVDLNAKQLAKQMLRQQIESVTLTKDAATSPTGLAIKDKSPADYDIDESSLVYAINTYEDLLKRQNQQSVETQASKPRVDEWQKAAVPIKKEMKKQIMFSAFAAMFGFVAVGACVTMYESKINRLFGSHELVRTPSLNVIGVLPEIGAGDAIATGADPARLKADPFMEGVEKVRLMLSRHFHGKRAQTILISSAGPGEGKTTLAGHLAVSLTRSDRKTIIVDANLRRPGMHEHLGLTAGPGVCELLRGDCTTTDAVQRSAIGNLWFLGAGVWDIGAQQAMGRDRFRRIIDKLRQEYDYVIIDSHDLSTVADTFLMGQHCDAVIVCARKYVSRKPLVEQAYQKVCDLGVPHTGVIFMGEAAK